MERIDITRASVDLDYWNFIAPPGAHCLINGGCFLKWRNGKQYYMYFGDNTWNESSFNWTLDEWATNKQKDTIITMKPDTPHKFVPNVGDECLAKCLAKNNIREWFKTIVKYKSNCTIVLDDGDNNEFVAHPITMKFKPISEQHAHWDKIMNLLNNAPIVFLEKERLVISNIILDNFNLEPKT